MSTAPELPVAPQQPHAPIPVIRQTLRPRSFLLLFAGVTLAAASYVIFQVPYKIAAGGIGGLSLIVNNFTGWPVGTTYFLL
ncbi:MAG: YitT family protein, partial [Caldilineaceae bacterium]